MVANEVHALGQIAAELQEVLGTTPAQSLHRAVAGRVFAAVPGSTPVRRIHDAIAGDAYTGVRLAARGAVAAAGLAAHVAAGGREARPISERSAGGALQAALNGLVGDRMATLGNALAIEMAVRHQGRDVALDGPALEAAFAQATGKVAVFVHGLGESEDAWKLRVRDRERPDAAIDAGCTYASRLARDLGYTPVSVRFNSGLHISDNGRRLSELLAALCTEWPGGMDELLLVGHSMGGLVIRSACHLGDGAGRRWVDAVGHVVCLGAPHLGAPLERFVNAAGWALRAAPETRPFGVLLETRSAGIKDLRFGYLSDEDWVHGDPDALLEDNRHDVPLLEGVHHLFVSATMGWAHTELLAGLVGDLLVSAASATGRDRIPLGVDDLRHVPGVSHLQLLNHPRVYEQMLAWLARTSPPERLALNR